MKSSFLSVRLGVGGDLQGGGHHAGFILGEPPKEEWTLVPPDGGWGWLVLGGKLFSIDFVNIIVNRLIVTRIF